VVPPKDGPFGVRMMSDIFGGNVPPKTHPKGAWIGIFKPNYENLKIAISPKPYILSVQNLITKTHIISGTSWVVQHSRIWNTTWLTSAIWTTCRWWYEFCHQILDWSDVYYCIGPHSSLGYIRRSAQHVQSTTHSSMCRRIGVARTRAAIGWRERKPVLLPSICPYSRQFLANVNSRSRSLYATRPSVVCRLSVCRLSSVCL